MNQASSFVPDSAQMKPLRLGQGPQLGRNLPLGQPIQQAQGGQAPVQAPSPVHQPAQISQSNAPKGAQPVTLIQPAAMGQAAPSRPAPQAPAAPVFARPANPQSEVRRVSLVTVGPDGMKYLSEFDAVVPRGSSTMGLSERVIE